MADAVSADPGDVLVMVGTRKGSFLLSSGPDRRRAPHVPTRLTPMDEIDRVKERRYTPPIRRQTVAARPVRIWEILV